MLLFFLKKTVKNLEDFGVPNAKSLQGEMEWLEHAIVVLEVEDLIFVEKNPSNPCLDSFMGSRLLWVTLRPFWRSLDLISWFDSSTQVFKHLLQGKGGGGVWSIITQIALLENGSDMATLERHIHETKDLMVLVGR
ncbi:hypothetical protein AMTRI_Chr09g18670 [Amborella trichopoda]